MASPSLRQPLEETFGRLRQRLADVLAEGRARGEIDAALDPPDTAAPSTHGLRYQVLHLSAPGLATIDAGRQW